MNHPIAVISFFNDLLLSIQGSRKGQQLLVTTAQDISDDVQWIPSFMMLR